MKLLNYAFQECFIKLMGIYQVNVLIFNENSNDGLQIVFQYVISNSFDLAKNNFSLKLRQYT